MGGRPDRGGLGGGLRYPHPTAPDPPRTSLAWRPQVCKLKFRKEQAREGRATLFAPSLARSVSDDIKLAQQARAQPGAPRAPGEVQSRRAVTGGPGPHPVALDPQGRAEQFLVQHRGICWAPASCGKAAGARRPGGSEAPVNSKCSSLPSVAPAFKPP